MSYQIESKIKGLKEYLYPIGKNPKEPDGWDACEALEDLESAERSEKLDIESQQLLSEIKEIASQSPLVKRGHSILRYGVQR